MSYWGDDRGQAIQIGAVLLLGALVIAFSLYQALVVPDQNREVEFKHNQEVQGQLQELRNAFVSTTSGGDRQSVTLRLGAQYPSRVVALNPGPPSGVLSTEGTTNESINATIENANATGEVGDFWTGDDKVFNTGSVVYRPGYNEYSGAPATVYEHSVLYNRFADSNLTLTGQRLVDGDEISLVTLNGSYYASRPDTVSVDVRPVSAASTTVSVTNTTNSTLNVTVPTRLNKGDWVELLDGEFTGNGSNGGNVVRLETTAVPGEDYQLLTVVFQQGVTYDLQLARAGIGTNVVRPGAAYLTDLEGNGSTVPENGTTEMTVQVRDRFDNPVGNVEVTANTSNDVSSVSPSNASSDRNGEVTFTYEAPADISGVSQETDEIRASINVTAAEAGDPSFDGSSPENVTMVVKVDNSDGSGLGGGGNDSAYRINWNDPSGQTGVDCPGGAGGTCTVNASRTGSVTLTAETSPTVQNANADFTVSNTTVGTVFPPSNQTDSGGEAETKFTVNNNGSVIAFVSSGGSGDQLDLVVENVTSGNTPPTASFNYSPTNPNVGETVSFDASASSDSDGSITSYEWDWTGDGTFEGSGETTTNSYASSGDYTVTLTVTDNDGATDSTTQTVNVSSAGSVSYNNDALSYENASETTSSQTREGLFFSIDSTYSSAVNVTSVTIDPLNDSIGGLDDGGVFGKGKNESELRVETTPTPGYNDLPGGEGIDPGGLTVDLFGSSDPDNTQEAQIASGNTAELWFYRFVQDNAGNDDVEVDVACEEFDITVTTNKSSISFTATASPPTGDCTTPPSDLTLDSPTTQQTRASSDTIDVTYSYTEDNPDRTVVSFDDGNGNVANYSVNDFGYAGDNSSRSVTLDLSNPDTTSGNGFVDGNTYDITINATDVGGQSSSVTETSLLTIDDGAPTITTSTFNDSDDLINDTEANAKVRRSVTFQFDEEMDQSVTPTITYENVAQSGNYTVVSANSGWVNATSYEQVLEFDDGDIDTPTMAVVSGAEDTAGNVMNTERPLSFTIDTRTPGEPKNVFIDTTAINASNQNGVAATLVNPDSLDGDEVAVLSIVNTTTGDSVTVSKMITTAAGDNTTFTGINVSSLPDGLVIAEGFVRDDAGNTGGTVQNDETTKDTVAPTISDFRLTNPSGDMVKVTFNASESLDTARVPVTYEDGSTANTFVYDANMSESQVGSLYEYTGSFTVSQDGNYTGTLTFANDSVDNKATTGQSDKTSIGPSSDFIVYNSDQSATTDGRLDFSVENTGFRNVTITQFNISVRQGSPDRVFEDSSGSGAKQNEVFVSADRNGIYDPSDTDTVSNDDGYDLNTEPTVEFAPDPVLTGQSSGAFTIYQFQKDQGGYGAFDVSGTRVEIGLTFSDGSTKVVVLPK